MFLRELMCVLGKNGFDLQLPMFFQGVCEGDDGGISGTVCVKIHLAEFPIAQMDRKKALCPLGIA